MIIETSRRDIFKGQIFGQIGTIVRYPVLRDVGAGEKANDQGYLAFEQQEAGRRRLGGEPNTEMR
jgi:hypothetical protein